MRPLAVVVLVLGMFEVPQILRLATSSPDVTVSSDILPFLRDEAHTAATDRLLALVLAFLTINRFVLAFDFKSKGALLINALCFLVEFIYFCLEGWFFSKTLATDVNGLSDPAGRGAKPIVIIAVVGCMTIALLKEYLAVSARDNGKEHDA